MIDSGSDHGGSSRSVVTGGLGWTARFVEFWRRVSHGDGSIGSDLSAVCVDVGLALSATATCHSYPSRASWALLTRCWRVLLKG
ncbi:unnamed protein product [Brassica oleracea]